MKTNDNGWCIWKVPDIKYDRRCHLSTNSIIDRWRGKIALIVSVDRLFLLDSDYSIEIEFNVFFPHFSLFYPNHFFTSSAVSLPFFYSNLLIPLMINVWMHAKRINFILPVHSHTHARTRRIELKMVYFCRCRRSQFPAAFQSVHFSLRIESQAVVHRVRCVYSFLLFMWFVAVSLICVCTFVCVAKWE